MYLVTIQTGQQGAPPLKLKTEDRKLARSIFVLCEENEVSCEVVEEVKPRPVTFSLRV